MKKILCLILALALSVTFMVACGNDSSDTTTTQTENNAEQTPDTSTDEAVTENTESGDTEKHTPVNNTQTSKDTSKKEESTSSNKDVITDSSNTPDVYLISSGGSDEDNISYHLEGCSALSGNEYQKATWEMVQLLAFRQCTKCNPPKYEGYVD